MTAAMGQQHAAPLAGQNGAPPPPPESLAPRLAHEGDVVASNTSEQWPQRTQPSEIFSWSGTTRNIVPQAGQLVIRLMSRAIVGIRPAAQKRAVMRIQPSSSSLTSKAGVRRVGRLQFVGLALQDAGQHQGAARRDVAAQQRRQHLQRRGQDVGQHVSGTCRCPRPAGRRSAARRWPGHCPRWPSPRPRRCRRHRPSRRAELGRADGQDAGAAAVVEHALPWGGPCRDPAQAHARGGMRAGAEGQAGVEPDHLRACGGGSCQVGTIQNSGVICTGANCDCVSRTQSCSGTARRRAACSRRRSPAAQQRGRFLRQPPRRGTARSARALPALLGRRHAGLAEQGLLGGVCASASSTETLSASSASSASLTASTRSSGPAGATRTCGRLIACACAATATLPGSGCWCRPHELGVDHQLAVQRDVGLDAFDHRLASAVRMRASACSRVSPCTMILPIIES
jgi:hypothetical protein